MYDISSDDKRYCYISPFESHKAINIGFLLVLNVKKTLTPFWFSVDDTSLILEPKAYTY